MKEKIILIILVVTIILFSGCSFKDISSFNEKPSEFYYTEKLRDSIEKDSLTFSVLCMNYYKGKILNKNEISLVTTFLSLVDEENFISKPEDFNENARYKFFIESKKEKYVINIYNSQYISIHPWDGKHEADFIDMENIYSSYNAYNLSKYFVSTLGKDDTINDSEKESTETP